MSNKYKDKYIKYKNKYLKLKINLISGGRKTDKKTDNPIDKEIINLYRKNNLSPKESINMYSYNDILKYYSNITTNKTNNQTIIDIKVKYDNSIEKLHSITNYFVLPVRMKCLIENNTETPYELYLKEKKENNLVTKYKLHQILKSSCTLLQFTRIIYILHLLYPNNTNIKYIDSSSGWGDRLIASLLYGVKEYRGYDPNTSLTNKYNEIINYFNKNNLYGKYSNNKNKLNTKNYKIIPKPFEIDYNDEINLINYFDICVSSPPFFTFEKYSDEPTQSIYNNGKEIDIQTWLNLFLYPSFKKLLKLIKPKGYIVWYIEDKPNYQFIDDFINYCKTLDCIFYGKIGFGYDDVDKIRYYIVFQKN
jgi:hypothetical protein